MNRDQVNATLFLVGLTFGMYRWATMTILEEQAQWLRAWSPTRLHS